MTALADLLKHRIARSGPITMADFMADCLLHPTHGYYATRDPFGQTGDFITAPEISQMFGEMIGLFLAQVWIDQGRPTPFALAEPGPGRGTLMADILRAAKAVPGFVNAAEVHLVEASKTLKEIQRNTLKKNNTVHWHSSLPTLPDMPLFLVANEFFDALPIRQFQRDENGWREQLLGLSGEALQFGLSDPAPIAALANRITDTHTGDMVETCQPAQAFMAEIDARISHYGGVALIIDYGDWRSLGDTLQALRNHTPEDPLANPGNADLTAHVDFEAIATAAPHLQATAMTPQGVFLERLGITQRAQMLAQNLAGAALEDHISAHRRLTHPEEMGTLFKTLAFTPKGAPTPPGFAA